MDESERVERVLIRIAVPQKQVHVWTVPKGPLSIAWPQRRTREDNVQTNGPVFNVGSSNKFSSSGALFTYCHYSPWRVGAGPQPKWRFGRTKTFNHGSAEAKERFLLHLKSSQGNLEAGLARPTMKCAQLMPRSQSVPHLAVDHFLQADCRKKKKKKKEEKGLPQREKLDWQEAQPLNLIVGWCGRFLFFVNFHKTFASGQKIKF